MSETKRRPRVPRVHDLSYGIKANLTSTQQAILTALKAVEGTGRFLDRLYVSAQQNANGTVCVHFERPSIGCPPEERDTLNAFPVDLVVQGDEIIEHSASERWCCSKRYMKRNIEKDRRFCAAAVVACSYGFSGSSFRLKDTFRMAIRECVFVPPCPELPDHYSVLFHEIPFRLSGHRFVEVSLDLRIIGYESGT